MAVERNRTKQLERVRMGFDDIRNKQEMNFCFTTMSKLCLLPCVC